MVYQFFTIGHSTRPIGEFIALLRNVEVRLVVGCSNRGGPRAFTQFTLSRARGTRFTSIIVKAQRGKARRQSKVMIVYHALHISSFRHVAERHRGAGFVALLGRTISRIIVHKFTSRAGCKFVSQSTLGTLWLPCLLHQTDDHSRFSASRSSRALAIQS
jgi:hypothetical protein